jgi:V/A-type H+-transporting ATPase subunit A
MGYRVAVMADSLSRWAEALREMGARLQEMPGEEGYPTYLGNRLGKWYERAGRVRPLGSPEREGTLTIISAVSPPGGDLSEPVTQTSVRVTGALWALDASLANQRHFPAVDWETSYSLYEGVTARWFAETVAPEWPAARQEMLALLERDRELREIAGLVGQEALQDRDRLLLAVARVVREAVLAQDAYDPNDAASSPARTYRLVELTRRLYQGADEALARGVALDRLDLGQLGHRLVALRRTPDDAFTTQADEAEAAIAALGQTAVETA